MRLDYLAISSQKLHDSLKIKQGFKIRKAILYRIAFLILVPNSTESSNKIINDIIQILEFNL